MTKLQRVLHYASFGVFENYSFYQLVAVVFDMASVVCVAYCNLVSPLAAWRENNPQLKQWLAIFRGMA